MWIHDSGGCLIGSKEKFCCDDWYVNEKTGKYACFLTTFSAHFDRPSKISRPSELAKRKGFKRDLKTERHLNSKKE